MRHPNLWLGLLLAPLAAQAAPPLTLPRVNLLSNPSFEWDQEVGQRVVQDGYAFGWGLWGQENVYGVYSPRSVPSFAAGAVEGARAQQIAWQADGTTLLHVNQDVHQVKPSLAYTLSAYVKAEPADAAEFDVMINFINAKGEWTDAGASRPIRAAEWTRLSLTGTTPADISWVRCIIHAKPTKPGAQATLWVDAAQFEEGSTATEFTPCYRVGEFVTVMQPTEKSFPNKLSWLAAQPSGTDLRFQLRSARTEAALADAPWQGPEGADAYALAVDSGPNLLPDPSVEQEGGDDPPRELAWGDNDHPFTATAEAHTGQRALQARITRFGGGAARYGVPYAGELQPNQRYSFAVWHREDSPQTPVQMSVSLELADGTMRWGRFGQSKPGSAAWRRDRIVFTTPAQPLRRVLLELVLLGQGTVTSDDYDLRLVSGGDAWPVASRPNEEAWLQARVVLSTIDPAVGPELYDWRLSHDDTAEIEWLSVATADGSHECYHFQPGETALFRPQFADYAGRGAPGSLRLRSPAGKEFTVTLTEAARADPVRRIARGSFTFPPDAGPGDWHAMVGGDAARRSVVLRVGPPYRNHDRQLRLGAIVADFGFHRDRGEALDKLIATYRAAGGLDVWLLSFNWARLQPTPGELNPDVVAGLRRFLAAAQESGVKVRLAPQQQTFPRWANNGEADNAERYDLGPTSRLSDLWCRLARELRDCPALDSYNLINEENAIPNADLYLRAMARIQGDLREIDPNPAHRVSVRPNSTDPALRTLIGRFTALDYDYGTGCYPTHWSWYFKRYANPISQTSFLRMARLRMSPNVFGWPGGIGEIGFFIRKPGDPFGDEERLRGFERAMTIAYELGQTDFCCWSDSFSFSDPATYYPKLAVFRDELVKQPRPARLDVRMLLDTGDPLFVESNQSALDLAKQPLLPAIRWLDEHGYVWYYSSPEAVPYEAESAVAEVKSSELVGRDAAQVLSQKLAGVKPSGTELLWVENGE
jgi:hypothetical protein